MMQPCVERYGRLDGLTNLASSESSSSQSDIAFATYWLESDKLYMAGSGNCTTMSASYAHCYSLRQLDVSNWTTTNWSITTLANTFNDCIGLMNQI